MGTFLSGLVVGCWRHAARVRSCSRGNTKPTNCVVPPVTGLGWREKRCDHCGREQRRRKEEAAREQAIARVQAALGKSEREHHEGVVRVTGGTIDRLAGSALLEFKRGKRARGAASIQGV